METTLKLRKLGHSKNFFDISYSFCFCYFKASTIVLFILFFQDIAVRLQIRVVGEVYNSFEFKNYLLECRISVQMLIYESYWLTWVNNQSTHEADQSTWRIWFSGNSCVGRPMSPVSRHADVPIANQSTCRLCWSTCRIRSSVLSISIDLNLCRLTSKLVKTCFFHTFKFRFTLYMFLTSVQPWNTSSILLNTKWAHSMF